MRNVPVGTAQRVRIDGAATIAVRAMMLVQSADVFMA